MFSFKQTATLLAGLGALMVSVHAGSVLLVQCTQGNSCLASVYFGIATVAEPQMFLNDISQTTAVSVAPTTGLNFADVHGVVQTVGVYALLIGMVLLLILELRELKLLGKRLRQPQAKAKH